jgi:hypothetical protein
MNFDSLLEVALDGYSDAFITGLQKARDENYKIAESTLIKAVTKNGMYLEYIDESLRTIPICIAAVKQNGDAFNFVSEEQKGISILEALNHSDPLPENNVALEALKTNGMSLRYMSDLSDNANICIFAARSHGCSLEFMNPTMLATPEGLPILQAAINQTPFALQFIKSEYFANKDDYYAVCKTAVQSRGELLQYVSNPTCEICILAVQSNPYAIRWVPTCISA